MSETYKRRVSVKVRVRVKFRNQHNFISDKLPFRQVTCNLGNALATYVHGIPNGQKTMHIAT